MSSSIPPTKLPSSFLALPREIRFEIFSYLLNPLINRHDPVPLDADPKDSDPAPYYSYTHLTPLLLTNRLIGSEALSCFHAINTFVKITTPFPGAISHVQNEGRVALLYSSAEPPSPPDSFSTHEEAEVYINKRNNYNNEANATCRARTFQHFTLRAVISSPQFSDWGSSVTANAMEDDDANVDGQGDGTHGITPRDAALSHFDQGEYSMVTLVEELDAFTRIWHLSHLGSACQLNGHLALRLDLKNPLRAGNPVPKALQERLLVPFGRVKGLSGFEVEEEKEGGKMAGTGPRRPAFEGGEVFPSVLAKVREEMAKSFPSPTEALEACQQSKEEGNRCIVAKKYDLALEAFFAAFAHVHIFIQGRRREIHCDGYYNHELMTGTFAGQYGHHVRLMLRTQLVSAVMQVYLLTSRPDEALFWGQRSIRLFRSSMQETSAIGGEGWEAWIKEVASVAFAGRNDMGLLLFRAAAAKHEIMMRKINEEGLQSFGGKTVAEEDEELKALLRAADIFAHRHPLLHAEINAWRLRKHVWFREFREQKNGHRYA